MYPQAELDLLSRRKRDLLSSIRTRRDDLAGHVEQVFRPIMWADRLYAKWRVIAPVMKCVAVPLGHVLRQKLVSKTGGSGGGLFRWVPLAMNFFRSMR